MKTNVLRNVALLLFSLAVAGSAADKVVIRGSNTIGEELAPRLIKEYQKERADAEFDLEFKGTTYGLGALMVGRCDIAAASREASKNEVALAKDREIEFNSYVIGEYSVAVVVNSNNPVADLKPEQVRDIFTGAIQNWKDVGGPDAPIHLFIRDPISGTYLGFQELAMDRKPYALNLKPFTGYAEIAAAVAKDPHGIGYTSIELTTAAGVKGVAIGGVPPTATTANKGQYPYTRLLRLYTDKAKESPAALDFIKFVQSPAGQKVLDQMGFVPRS